MYSLARYDREIEDKEYCYVNWGCDQTRDVFFGDCRPDDVLDAVSEHEDEKKCLQGRSEGKIRKK